MSGQIITVLPKDAGVRLDAFIASAAYQYSRSFIANLIKSGNIKVSGQIKKPSYKVLRDDIISINIPPPIKSVLEPQPIEIKIIFEDKDIIIINKQPNLVVHPACGNPSNTLANAILYHCPDLKGIGGELRPGIVHRLDKDTSGIMVIAKNDNAHNILALQFKNRTVKKKYLAIVHGEPIMPSCKINIPITRHPTDRKKFIASNTKHSKPAETNYRVKEKFGDFSLLEVQIKTGRTHQIRVHLLAIKHPIAGDAIYNTRKSKEKEKPFEVTRQMLHSHSLGFIHPKTEKYVCFEAELYPDIQIFFDKLRQKSLSI
ncbi:MAG: RluA family pseudouridine synthase [Deltaproteobacteria bacterium]|nr:RluA family pseudouridine synthase [Deltaproteobacteria bacterium]